MPVFLVAVLITLHLNGVFGSGLVPYAESLWRMVVQGLESVTYFKGSFEAVGEDPLAGVSSVSQVFEWLFCGREIRIVLISWSLPRRNV